MFVAIMSEEQRNFTTKLSEYVFSDSDGTLSDTSQVSEKYEENAKLKFLDHVFVSSDPIDKRLVNCFFEKNRHRIKRHTEIP
jgi:hypothetical protein